MDPIEKAIRNAFEKGNADDRAFREKVYRSAFAALDRALQANPSLTVETAIKRRKAMQAKITEIESEYLPAVSVASPDVEMGENAPPVVTPSIEAAQVPVAPDVVSANRREPSFDPEIGAPHITASPSVDGPTITEPVLAGSALQERNFGNDAYQVAPDRDERRSTRRRFPFRSLVLGLIMLALAGTGLWWAVQNGLLTMPAQSPAPSPATEGQASAPAAGEPGLSGQADESRNWITVFSPDDPTLVSAPADAMAEVMKDDSGSFLRIRSGKSGSAINFDVGQGILENLSGKHAVFDILARSEEGKDTQMSVDCNFGELGDCGRKRYAVGHERNEYLFDVQFPDKRPGAAGSIAVNSDFNKQGKSVDIYQIRVSVTE